MNAHDVKILIVDDSVIFRKAVEAALKETDGIKVIGSVRNGVKAMEFIWEKPPDLVTLDIEMPDMDGLQTLEQIQKYNSEHSYSKPIGVIMLSSHTKKGADTTIKALELGAFDFITKPESNSESESIEFLKRSLIPRVYNFATRRDLGVKTTLPPPQLEITKEIKKEKIIEPQAAINSLFIGISTGGPKSLNDMLPKLCSVTTQPIFIVQHMPPAFTESLAESLGKKCSHRVKEAQDGEVVCDRTVYIAKGGYHMVVRKSAGNRVLLGIIDQPPENGCKPSVDVLFRSIPAAYDSGAIAMILTGMGNDGSQSLRLLKRSGIIVLAQDEASSVVWGMPRAAFETGLVDKVVSLLDIPGVIENFCKSKK